MSRISLGHCLMIMDSSNKVNYKYAIRYSRNNFKKPKQQANDVNIALIALGPIIFYIMLILISLLVLEL